MDRLPRPTPRTYLERPTREAIALLPAYAGLTLEAVTLVSSEVYAECARIALAGHAVLGFDTESKPTFTAGAQRTGPHLVQLATPTQAFLFRTEDPYAREVLREVLESPRVMKVGFGLSNDRGPLAAKTGIRLRGTVDLSAAVKRMGYKQKVGLQAAVAIVLGERMPKSKNVQTSNWSARELSNAQRLYAANDAHAGLRVYQALRELRPELVTVS